MFRIKYLFITLIIILNFGCATLMSGRYQDIEVNTVPYNTYVIVNGVKYRTPCIINLKKSKATYTLIFQKDGYETVEIKIKKKPSFWTCGNLLLIPVEPPYGAALGILSIIFDFANGSLYSLRPQKIEVIMNKKDKSGVSEKVIYVYITKDNLKLWVK